MLFNSYIFVLLFLPLCVIGYFLCNKINRTVGNLFLIGMSLWFYGYNNVSYLLLISSSIIINFGISRLLSQDRSTKVKKLILWIGMIFNIGLIFYYKYLGFTIWNINMIFGTDIVIKEILLPLGISFFTFQQISFVVDSYHGETKDYNFIEYALFVLYFPQLIAGPIVLHSEMIPQLRDDSKRTVNYENIMSGITLFTYGLFKKVMVADTLSRATTWGYANPYDLTSLESFIVMLCFMLQIYFDFSAYSDMATGVARCFNLDLPLNFDSPLKSLSPGEFWKRWHITLNRFLTSYIYIPLGGSRKGEFRTYLNLMMIFVVSGIWHGASYTYIGWALFNGVAVCLYRKFRKPYEKIPKPLQFIFTFLFEVLTGGLFGAHSTRQWASMMKTLFTARNFSISSSFSYCFRTTEIELLISKLHLEELVTRMPVLPMIAILAPILFGTFFLQNNIRRKFKLNAGSLVLTSLILLWCICSFAQVSVFMYFNF